MHIILLYGSETYIDICYACGTQLVHWCSIFYYWWTENKMIDCALKNQRRYCLGEKFWDVKILWIFVHVFHCRMRLLKKINKYKLRIYNFVVRSRKGLILRDINIMGTTETAITYQILILRCFILFLYSY